MFNSIIILTCSLTITLTLDGLDINYCSFPCSKTEQHTICNLKHNCEVSSRCKNFTNLPFTDQEKQVIVNTHNNLRNRIALGIGCRSREGKLFPKAAAMRELVWDKELEFQAQCWANQCLVRHDKCRTKYDGQPAGQNIVWTEDEFIETNLRRFFDDCKNTSTSVVNQFHYSGGPMIGLFTQFVWWNTSQIGCSRARYVHPNQNYTRVFTGCNYAWVGNTIGSKVYPKGKPCSQCPKDTKCHPNYTGLCTTKPSQSEVPNICKFAANRSRCIPYLAISGNQSHLNGTLSEDQRRRFHELILLHPESFERNNENTIRSFSCMLIATCSIICYC